MSITRDEHTAAALRHEAAPRRDSDAARRMLALAKDGRSRADAAQSCGMDRQRLRNVDKALYGERTLIKRFFNELKQFRRVATRYDKLLANNEGIVQLAAIAILIR